MKKEPKIYIEDMLESVKQIRTYVDGITFDEFTESLEKQDAVLRRFEILGEAANHIPTDLHNAYPEIPWRKIIGLRNLIVHDYSSVDLEIIWDVIHKDLQETEGLLEHMIERLQ